MNATMALMGNPNSGKTTLFNSLTGSRQHVGNYPGITVEKREGRLKINELDMTVVDLPGTYSLTAYTQDEVVARNFLMENDPDAVVTVLDATNLERSLYLELQILELGMPVIVVLNMMDEVRRKGVTIDTKRLSSLLGLPVLEMVARSGEGKEGLLETARDAIRGKARPEPLYISYGADLDKALEEMQGLIQSSGFLGQHCPARWVAIKYLENDPEILSRGQAANPDVHARLQEIAKALGEHCQKTLNMDTEALVADYRYGFISALLKDGVITRPSTQQRFDLTDRLDAFLTHRLLGPILMFVIIYLMFEVTFAVGEIPMGWVESFYGPHGLHAGPGLQGFWTARLLRHAVHHLRRHTRRMRRARRHGRAHAAQPQRKNRHSADGSISELWSQGSRFSSAGRGVFPRRGSQGPVLDYSGRMEHGPADGPPAAFHHHQGPGHSLCHGTAALPHAHPAWAVPAHLGTGLAV